MLSRAEEQRLFQRNPWREVFAIGLSNGFHCKDLVMALVADDPTLLLCYVERWLKIFAGEIILDHASDPRRFTENRPWMFHCGLPCVIREGIR